MLETMLAANSNPEDNHGSDLDFDTDTITITLESEGIEGTDWRERRTPWRYRPLPAGYYRPYLG